MIRSYLLICVVLAIVGFAFAAPAGTVAFVDSTGHAGVVDTQNPGVHAMPTYPPETIGKAGGITFHVFYQDVADANGRGFDDPIQGVTRRARLNEVLTYINSVLDHTGVCDIKMLASETDGSGALAVGGTYFSFTPGRTNGFAFAHITTGTDPDPGVPDIYVTVDFGWPWYQGTGAPPFNQLDLASVLIHELTHGLGILTLSDASGNSQIAPNVYAYWDDYLETTGSSKDLFGGSPFIFHGVPSDLVGADGGVRFKGPAATAAFLETKPPIFAPNPFQPGSSLAHWDSSGKITGNAVMEPSFMFGEVIRQYAPVDLGALEDIGYVMAGQPGFGFTQQPAGGWFEEDDRLSMSVAVANATGSVAYQWVKDDGDIPGATTTTFTIPALELTDSGQYRCRATDQNEAIESETTVVMVYPAGSLPVTGTTGLAIIGIACIVIGVRRLRRRSA